MSSFYLNSFKKCKIQSNLCWRPAVNNGQPESHPINIITTNITFKMTTSEQRPVILVPRVVVVPRFVLSNCWQIAFKQPTSVETAHCQSYPMSDKCQNEFLWNLFPKISNLKIPPRLQLKDSLCSLALKQNAFVKLHQSCHKHPLKFISSLLYSTLQ